MHIIKSIRRYCFFSSYSLVFALLLMACGSTTYGSGISSNSAHASQHTPAASSSTIATSNKPATGCPNSTVVTGPSGKANIVVTDRQMNQTITAHNGDTIEIQLPFGHKWTGPTTSQGLLQLQGPAGYASNSASACIWRFVARGTGKVQLIFHSQALCQAGQICPMYITAIPFDFSVK